MSLAMDFAAMMKAERAKARGGAPAAPSAPQAASAIRQPRRRRVRSTTTRCGAPTAAFDAARPLARSAVGVAPARLDHVDEEARSRDAPAAAPERWTRLRGRRLQNLGRVAEAPPEGMHAEPLPPWVASVCDALVAAGVFDADAPPNHVLLNEYQPGQGIDAHRDGPLYAPRVAILSLCSHCAFEFLRNDAARDAVCSLLLPPRGVLVFSDDAYHELLHGARRRRRRRAAAAGRRADRPPRRRRGGPPRRAAAASRSRCAACSRSARSRAAARALGAQRRRRALRRRAGVRGARWRASRGRDTRVAE